ncbi:MAG: hypothetical protein V4666_04800 [Bacteroidota bacterium]
MTGNKIDDFNNNAPEIFKDLITDFGYELKEVRTRYLNDNKWSAHHQYLNHKLNLEIKISQEPYYTDYGLSIFISNLKNKQEVILLNYPHELQGESGEFLKLAKENLFKNKECLDLIKGLNWEVYNRILIKF